MSRSRTLLIGMLALILLPVAAYALGLGTNTATQIVTLAIAALLVGVVRGITIHFVPAAGEASMYVLMFLVLMFRPRGLLGERIEKFE